MAHCANFQLVNPRQEQDEFAMTTGFHTQNTEYDLTTTANVRMRMLSETAESGKSARISLSQSCDKNKSFVFAKRTKEMHVRNKQLGQKLKLVEKISKKKFPNE